MRTRVVELYLAIVMTLCGAILMEEGDSLSLVYLDVLRAWVQVFPGSESRLGMLLAVIGLARTAAIAINGLWRPTPVIRMFGCLVGSLMWATFALTIFRAAEGRPLPMILGFASTAVVFEWFSIVCATIDAHRYNSLGCRTMGRARNNGRGH